MSLFVRATWSDLVGDVWISVLNHSKICWLSVGIVSKILVQREWIMFLSPNISQATTNEIGVDSPCILTNKIILILYACWYLQHCNLCFFDGNLTHIHQSILVLPTHKLLFWGLVLIPLAMPNKFLVSGQVSFFALFQSVYCNTNCWCLFPVPLIVVESMNPSSFEVWCWFLFPLLAQTHFIDLHWK